MTKTERTLMGHRIYLSLYLGLASYASCVIAADNPTGHEQQLPGIEVNANEHKTSSPPTFSELTDKLQPDANRTANAPHLSGSEAIINRPGNQLDLFNRAATGHRMGNTFGTSVSPQRPVQVPPTSPFTPQK